MINSGDYYNPIVVLRAQVSALLSLLGVALMLLVSAGLLLYEWRRRQQRALARLQTQTVADRRRFLRRLDHELKNPLTAIRAGLANLAASLPDAGADDGRRIWHSIDAQALRLSRLTADLRKLSDLETVTLDRGPVAVGSLLQEAIDLAQEKPQAHDRRLSLTLPQAPWPLPPVAGDWDLIYLAVYNLLDNSLKFTRPGDTIEVRAYEVGDRVAIEIADTGPGIPAAEAPHVWEELYRGESARGVPGSGLGLALARAIIERHGGHITLRSRAGQGTVVTLRLPVSTS